MINVFARLWPAAFTAVLMFLVASCTEPDVIGLDLQPASEQPGLTTDTLQVETYVVAEDSLVVWSKLKNLIELPTFYLGSYDDPYAGKSFAGFVSQVRLGNTITDGTFGGATSADSVVLSFLYKDINGDTTSTHRISVYELAQDLSADSVYYSNRSYSRTNFLGHAELIPRIKDSVVVGGSKAAPQLRIPLDTAFGGKLLRDYISNKALFSDNTAFLNYFKGVVLVDSSDGQGSIVTFPSTSGVHRLTIYFSGNKSYEFIIDQNCVRMSYFKHEYNSGLNDQQQDDNLLVQSMAGLKDSLKVVDLEKLYADGPVSISSAKLVFTVQGGSTDKYFQPHVNLLIFGSDSLGQNITTPDANESAAYYGGVFDATKNEYTFNIARYLQKTLTKVVEQGGKDYGLFLVAGGSTSNARRTVLQGKTSVKLIVTTTKINP